MTAQILDGTATAKAIKGELTERVAKLREQGVVPGLGTVLVGDDPGSTWYVNGKHKDCAEVGIESHPRGPARRPRRRTRSRPPYAASTTTRPAPATSCSCRCPKGIDENAVLGEIDPAKDADGLHPTNLGWLVLGKDGPLPCTPYGIVELLRRHERRDRAAPTSSSSAAASPSAGRWACCSPAAPRTPPSPCATPAPVTSPPTSATPTSWSPPPACPGIITGDMVKPGAAVLDVGVSRVDGKIAGDVAQSVYDVAAWVSPNPGGVGPMTRAMLLSNVVAAAEADSGVGLGQSAARDDAGRAATDPVHAGRPGLPDRGRDQRRGPADHRVRPLASRRRLIGLALLVGALARDRPLRPQRRHAPRPPQPLGRRTHARWRRHGADRARQRDPEPARLAVRGVNAGGLWWRSIRRPGSFGGRHRADRGFGSARSDQ